MFVHRDFTLLCYAIRKINKEEVAMKKFLLTLLSVLLFVCLGAAIACNGGNDTAKYYALIFRQTNGVTYSCDVPSGWEVKEGTTVNFKVIINSEVKGDPVVYADSNGESTELTATNGNSYSVVITGKTVIRVDGIMAQGQEYNKLVFENTPGVTFNGMEKELADGTKIKLESGMMVRMHEVISFSLVKNPKYQGTERVYANGTELTADVNGRYSLEMITPTTITVKGLIKHVDVTYAVGDSRVRYYTGNDDDKTYIEGDTKEDRTEGEELKFKVQVSVYNKRTPDKNGNLPYTVLANSTILKPDEEGYYHYILTDDTTIQVNGLKMEVSFVERANGGSGTIRDPFRLTSPIDLYQMAMLINGGFYTTGLFYAGYYSLEADIDLEGEQLYIIGDGSTGVSVFSGTFYGNGHTISNYTMTDIWINQENFNSTYITNVGLFGYVIPTETQNPAIYNLHVDNFTITADASKYPEPDGNVDYVLSVGAIAGIAYGLDMVGCSATNGNILVTAGDYGAYIGGLLGQQVSAYAAQLNIQAYSGVSSCYADVNISVANGTDSGFAYAAGGITGFLAVGEEHLVAYILNSYATGNIDGALNVGGIAGYAVAGTSIINCYSTGDVTAYSHFEFNSNWSGDYAYFREYYRANAGGIAGRVGFNTVIYNCFSQSEVYAKSEVHPEYEMMDGIAAYVESGSELQDAHSYVGTIYGCQDMFSQPITEDFIRKTMKWDAEDWKMENGMPVINYDSSEKSFTIHFTPVGEGDFGNIADLKVNITEKGPITGYLTMSMWNSIANGIPEYMDGKNGLRSYAYFLDPELTQRAFFSFIPTGDVTLYVGFADYSEVAGTYYLGESVANGAKLEVNVDGTFVYRNGALTHSSIYTWDGENITFLYAYLGDMAELPKEFRDYYLSSLYIFGGTVDNGKLSITGGYVQEVEYREDTIGYEDDGTPIKGMVMMSTGNNFLMFPEENPLIGVLAIEGFNYGKYYNNGTIYQFNGNGTGLRKVGNVETAFTYTVSGSNLTITYANGTETGTVSNGFVTVVNSNSVKPYDGFTGTWERSFAMNESYTFNGMAESGKGEWTYSGHNSAITSSGTYTVTDGVLNAGLFTATINEDGFLVINDGSHSNIYYMGGSFAGDWYYSHRLGENYNTTVTANVTFNGINNTGIGTASVEYGTGEVYDLTYHAVYARNTYTIYVYQNSYLYAELSYDAAKNILTGTIDGSSGSRLTAFDSFRGLWISNNADLPTVQFNGNGFNDLDASTNSNGSGPLAVRATVYINGKSAGKYSIDYATMIGTYTYKNVTYTLKYNEELDLIEASYNGGEPFTLVHRDMWYGRQLEDENGFVYTFEDGRGNLAEGGKLTASNGNISEDRLYTYHIEADGSIRLEARESSYQGGTISVQTYNGKSVFMFETANAKTPLTRHTTFTGEWIIGGESGIITIGKIYADDTATGSFKFRNDEAPVSVEFTYNFEGNYLTFEYKGTTMYVNALVSSTASELSVGPENSTSGRNNSICIAADRADDLYGVTYYMYDTVTGTDTGSTIVFDGLSASVFGNGMAVVYDAEGNVTGAYIYSVTETGTVQLIYNYWAYYMTRQMIKPERQLSLYELFCVHDDSNNYFIFARPDALGNLTVKDVSETGVSYTFDGVGGVVRHNANGTEDKFAYVIILTDNLNFKHIIQFTAEDGTVYSATLDQSSGDDPTYWTLKLTKADKYFGLAGWDGNASEYEAQFLFDGVNRVVRLSNTEAAINYTYVLVSEENGKSTFEFTDESGVKYTAIFDHSSANDNEWTVTLTK